MASIVSAEEDEIETISNECLDALDDEALESKGNSAKLNQPKLDVLKKMEDYLTQK